MTAKSATARLAAKINPPLDVRSGEVRPVGIHVPEPRALDRDVINRVAIEAEDFDPAPDHDPEFAALVRGRRVALVGPALTLSDRRQGDDIDRFDVVVRLNEAFEWMPPGWRLAQDIGTRTDILYCNQSILRSAILQRSWIVRRRIAHTFRVLGVRYAVCTNNSLAYTSRGRSEATCPAEDQGVPAALQRWLTSRRLAARCRVAHAAPWVLNRWLDGAWPRTGFVALFDVLSFEPSELWVGGMTFYHGGGHLLAPHGEPLHPLKNRDGLIVARGRWRRSRFDTRAGDHDLDHEVARAAHPRRRRSGQPSGIHYDARPWRRPSRISNALISTAARFSTKSSAIPRITT